MRRARLWDPQGTPRSANAYVVCRLCPLLLGDALVPNGSREQLRTNVCWGCEELVFDFRHTATLPPPGGRPGRRPCAEELVFEIWQIADVTLAEELVGLLRTRVTMASVILPLCWPLARSPPPDPRPTLPPHPRTHVVGGACAPGTSGHRSFRKPGPGTSGLVPEARATWHTCNSHLTPSRSI